MSLLQAAGVLLLALVVPAYVALNVLVIGWCVGHPSFLCMLSPRAQQRRRRLPAQIRHAQGQLWRKTDDALPTWFAWLHAATMLLVLLCGLTALEVPRAPWESAFLILMLIAAAAIPVMSIGWRSSALRQLAGHPAFAKTALLLGVVLGFLWKAVAGEQLAQLLQMSPANLPQTWWLGTAFVWLVWGGLGLLLLTLVAEVAMLAVMALTDPKRVGWNRVSSLWALSISAFLTCYAAGGGALRLAASPFTRVLLMDFAYEFDAVPARWCALDAAEMKLLAAQPLAIKALFFSTSQDKAFLLQAPPAQPPIMLRKITEATVKLHTPQVLRVAACNKESGGPQPDSAASAAP